MKSNLGSHRPVMIHQLVLFSLCVYTIQGCSPTIQVTGMAPSLQEVCTANQAQTDRDIPLEFRLLRNDRDPSCSEKVFLLTGVHTMVYRLESSSPQIIPQNYKRFKTSDNGTIVFNANTNRIFGIGAEITFTDGEFSQQIVVYGFFVRLCIGIRSESSSDSHCLIAHDQMKELLGYDFSFLPCGNRTFYYNESVCNTTELVKCAQPFDSYDDGQCFNGSVVYSQRKQVLSNNCDFRTDFSITNSGIWTRNQCTAEFEVCSNSMVNKDKHIAAIRCLSNCGVLANPQENIEVYLDCPGCTSQIQSIDWYTAECGSYDDGSCSSNKSHHQQYTNTRFLTLTNNDTEFLPSFHGIFVAAHFEDGSHSEASFIFQYSPIPTPGDCEVSPTTGYALLTDFNITCRNFSVSSGLNLTYTMYANTQDSINKALRLYKGKESYTELVKLQEGLVTNNHTIYIFVRATVDSGAFTMVTMSVQVLPAHEADTGVSTIDLVFEIAVKNDINGSSQIEDLFNTGNAEAAVQLIGIISSTLNSMNVTGDEQLKQRKVEARAAMISNLENVTENVPDFETLFTVTVVLNDVTGVKSELSEETQEKATKCYDFLAESLDAIINQTTSKTQVEDTAMSILQGVTGILDIVTDSGKDKLSNTTVQVLQSNGSVTANNSSVVKLKKSTDKLLQVVNKVGGSILTQQLVDQPPTVLHADSLTISVQKLTSDKLTNVTLSPSGTLNKSGCSIKFDGSSPILGADDVGVKVIRMQKNPYIWDSSASDVNLDVLSVDLLDTNKTVMKVDNLTTPVLIAFDIPETNDEINTTLYVHLQKDNETVIYDASKSNLITFNFTLVKNKTAVLKVTSTSNIRDFKMILSDQMTPNLDEVLNNGFSYPTESHLQTQYINFTLSDQNLSAVLQDVNEGLLYFHPNSSSLNETQTIYVGISVDINNTDTLHQLEQADTDCLSNTEMKTCSSDVEIPVAIETKLLSCTYWDENDQVWSNKGCEVSPYTTTTTLQCACTHLTSFAGGVFVLPNYVDPIEDAALFLTFFDNPVVFTAVFFVWSIYFLLVHWARRADKQDTKKVNETFQPVWLKFLPQ